MLKGKDGIVKTGSPLAALGAVQNWNVDEQADVVAGWGMGDAAESAFTTIKRYSGSVEVYLNFADESDDLAVGDEVAMELYPGGETTGSGYFSGTVLVTGLARSGAKDGIPALTINFRNASGVLSKGTVA
jgi:hypothetical protein